MWKHRSEFRKAILLLKLRRGIHVLGDIAAALDTGGTLVFRNEDGSKRTIEIPQLVADRGTISICDCHSVDVVASEPKNRAEFQKWYEDWSLTTQFKDLSLPADFEPPYRQIRKMWRIIHDPVHSSRKFFRKLK